MAAATSAVADAELAATTWDLEPLVNGRGEEGVLEGIEEAVRRAAAVRERYAGRLAELDSAGLAELMEELGAIREAAGRAASYAALRFAADTSDQSRGALLQRVRERATEIETSLIFFELEWAALDDERVEELLAGEGTERVRHFLRNARRYRPHLLTEPEERILAEKQVSGASAWSRLFTEHTSAIEVTPPGEAPMPLDVALGRLSSPDRELRRATAEAVTGGA